MTTRHEVLTGLAILMGLNPSQAVALPTAITVAAGKLEMDEPKFIGLCLGNQPLREYVASVCKQVTVNS